MPLIRPGIRRLFSLGTRGDTPPDDVDDEIALHLELRARQLEQEGVSPADAARIARERFGDRPIARHHLHHAAQRRDRTMNLREQFASLMQDVRYAARGLMRERWLTLFVAITLGLGIGVNAAMYGVVDRLLLRGPEYLRDASRLQTLHITEQMPGQAPRTNSSFGWVTYKLLHENAKKMQVAIFKYSNESVLYGNGLDAEQWSTGDATAGLFPLLGVTPMLGRFFNDVEDTPGAAQQVAVLGHGVWQRVFNSDSSIVGKTVELSDRQYTVIGVARPGFTGPGLQRVDVWLPMSLRSANNGTDFVSNWNSRWLNIIARLEPGATVTQANAEATALYRNAYAGHEKHMREASLLFTPISFAPDGSEPPELPISRWLIGVCVVVLIVACANVANLLLARALRRRREVAVRLALGVSRMRLLRLFLVESFMLSGIGAVAGLCIAFVAGTFMRNVLLPNVEWTSSPVSVGVLLVSIGIAAVVGIVIGLVPAWRSSRPDLTTALKSGVRDGGGNQSRMRTALTVAQAALSVVLLVGAGLFVKSLMNVRSLDLGIETNRVLVTTLRWRGMPPGASKEVRDAESARRDAVYPRVLERVRQLAEVEAASLTIGLPFQSAFGVTLKVPGWDSVPRIKSGPPTISAVANDYFKATGAPILRGRAFASADRDAGEREAMVSQTMAKTLWPDKEAIGQCLMIGSDSVPPCFRIVGVVPDARRFQLKEEPAMHYYVPFGKQKSLGIGGTTLIVRPRADMEATIAMLRRAAQEVDPTVSFVRVQLLQENIDPQIRPWKLGANMFSLMGVLALCVAAVGLYSVMSYLVAQRRQEMGIRMALGANGRDILRLILRSGVGTACTGVAIGVVIAFFAGRFVEPMLFETSSRDVQVYATVIVSLLLVSVLACLVPALRARRVNPIEALRTE
ncbi:MAG: ADOP family duplicated permease [Gemmatimonas sp.]